MIDINVSNGNAVWIDDTGGIGNWVFMHYGACDRAKIFNIRRISGSGDLVLMLAALIVHSAFGETFSQVEHIKSQGTVWSVDSDSGGRLYLCGAIHVLRSEDYPLAPAYEAAYMNSTRLVFELPPGSNSAGIPRKRMQDVGILPGDQSLQDMIGRTSWEGVEKWADIRKTSLGALARYRPWFAALTVAAIEYGSLGATPDKGVDSYFEARAAKDNKPGEGLETVDFQLGLFTSLTAAQQEALLKQTLAEARNLPDRFTKMLNAWKAGDLEALHSALYDEADQYPDLTDLFLHKRNKAWLAKLEEIMSKRDRVMVLVGAGHLAGEKGLIELLKGRGYKVERYSGQSVQGLPR